MPRRKLSKKATFQAPSSFPEVLPSPADLQRRWQTLKLNKETQERLQHLLLQEGGALVALAATEAVAFERGHQERTLSTSVVAWLDEQLRALFLEEGSSHIIESARIVTEALLAWNVAQGIARLPLPLLDLGLAAGCLLLLWLAHWLCRSRRNERSKRVAHSSRE
jgi:hypothetical protein